MARKLYKFIVKDKDGRTWGYGNTLEDIEPVCFSGRMLYTLNAYNEYYACPESSWLERPFRKSIHNFLRPANYRGNWLATTRDGHTLARGPTLDDVLAIGKAGTARAIWEWLDQESCYVQYMLEPRREFVMYKNHPYRCPREPRDTWLVMAASGRVWARGDSLESVLSIAASGNHRALWKLTGDEYELYAVDGEKVQA